MQNPFIGNLRRWRHCDGYVQPVRDSRVIPTLTANGFTQAYRVKLARVRVGAIELHEIDGVVVQQGPGVALLGMSFLNRLEMKRDGDTMTLTRRF